MSELQTTIIDQIQRSYHEAQALAISAAERGREAVLKARECGQYLITARDNAPGKKLKPWLMSHVTFISYETAQRWVRLAEAPLEDLEKALSLRQAYIAAGILPEPEGHESQTPSLLGGCKWLSLLDKTWEAIDRLKPEISGLPITQRESLKQKLKPLAELYANLVSHESQGQ